MKLDKTNVENITRHSRKKKSLARPRTLTYCGAKQFLPVRFEIEDHAPPGPWQSGPTDEQHQEDQIGKSGCHPDDLMQKRNINIRSVKCIRLLLSKSVQHNQSFCFNFKIV